MSIKIVKASGKTEDFHIQKLIQSLIRSGASKDIAWDIAKKVEKQIVPSMHTKQIFKLAKKFLRQYNRVTDMRYSIKKAIYALGPSGYQFERYFGRILKAYGYSVEVSCFLKGQCITHEVDVFAQKNGKVFIVECKYHSNGGIPTDVKIALYVYSRYTDIQNGFNQIPGNNLTISEGWLVTNTRCSPDAIKFAECVGLKIVSWKYPSHRSLEKMIEGKRLYPITVLSSIKKHAIELLFKNDIILAKDIADMDGKTFLKRSGLEFSSASVLKREADALCLCSGEW
jgi:hypothetical protein